MAYGFPLKKLDLREPLGLHLAHEINYAKETWRKNGGKLIEHVRRMNSDPRCVTMSFFSDLLTIEGSGEDYLDTVSNLICSQLP